MFLPYVIASRFEDPEAETERTEPERLVTTQAAGLDNLKKRCDELDSQMFEYQEAVGKHAQSTHAPEENLRDIKGKYAAAISDLVQAGYRCSLSKKAVAGREPGIAALKSVFIRR